MRLEYDASDLVRVAGRWNNPKRSYLLVDPLQAKHMPAVPSEAMAMMGELGRRAALAAPGCRLVIGFAETATAIGYAVASRMGPGCMYWHTTREKSPAGAGDLVFQESHSHAVDQVLRTGGLDEAIRGTDSIVFVDDELTTGNTLRGMVERMREAFPSMAGKKLVAACVVDRISGSDRAAMDADGISTVCLTSDIGCDPVGVASRYEVAPPAAAAAPASVPADVSDVGRIADPRSGVDAGSYGSDCARVAHRVLSWAWNNLPSRARVRVLGTEECMWPALVAAAFLEHAGYDVRCHATTRSPIGVCPDDGYPIRSSVRMDSLYESGRTTYLYCVEPMDYAVVVTDAGFDGVRFGGLSGALREPAHIFCAT